MIFFQKQPPYFITAKATDCKGYQSEWSTFEISMPKNRIINNQIIEILSKFTILKLLF